MNFKMNLKKNLMNFSLIYFPITHKTTPTYNKVINLRKLHNIALQDIDAHIIRLTSVTYISLTVSSNKVSVYSLQTS